MHFLSSVLKIHIRYYKCIVTREEENSSHLIIFNGFNSLAIVVNTTKV